MPRANQIPANVLALIKSFKTALRKFFGNCDRKRLPKENSSISFYQEAKKAQTQERNLIKALQLYTKAIETGQKKDSSIKDFASSLHQLGYTKAAVKLMDDCVDYYDGNKDKYFRLRDNLEIQIRPTGKHLCRFLLIENISQDIKFLPTQEEIRSSLFKSPKRIKSLKFLQDFELINQRDLCKKQEASNILVEFESFSAAKKTLESFYLDELFGSNLYWVNSQDMRIVCAAIDGKYDFEQGFIVNNELISQHLYQERESFWASFGESIYESKQSNGFINLLSTHLIKDFLGEDEKRRENKENIFESSKISETVMKECHQEFRVGERQMEPMRDQRINNYYPNSYQGNHWQVNRYGYYKQYYYY